MKRERPPVNVDQLDLPWSEPLGNQLPDEDAAARAAVLNTARSFIVRAPAGSGKTELLTQRVLALLAIAEAPEEIVAITFTRKAAAEMTERLLKALLAAASDPEPAEPYQASTWRLARAVVARDRERDWQLAANPGRIRVQTIDSLARWLAQQMPVTARFAASAQPIEQADHLYAAAASATLRIIDSDAPADQPLVAHLQRLLSHLDNNWARLHRLLSSMLSRRDQWLRNLGRLERAALEAPMQRECTRQIARLQDALSPGDSDELAALARYAADNVPPSAPVSACAGLERLPQADHADIAMWRALADLVLKQDGAWRSQVDKRLGFPPGRLGDPYKQRFEALISRWRSDAAVHAAWLALRELPAPRFTDSQWQVLESIVAVLPRAAAELALVFAEAGETDFTQVTRAAVDAFDEQGLDLAAALDTRLRHLLIDEFQDTSITQFELVGRLIADWRPGDGRTVFIVGDPMQSIYRFREAEVGLFLRAWNDGIGHLPLDRLRLSRNFRSQRALVDWVNATFAQVMPPESDMASGAVAFEPATAEHTAGLGPATAIHALVHGSAGDEAARVVEIVQRVRAEGASASIALLVRAKHHLSHILPALRGAGISFTAVELERLLEHPLVGDLFALTRALEHLADKVAWLAVLRAPWCGLTLHDLTALAESAGGATVWQLISSRTANLSADGQQRLARVAPLLARALEWRGRSALSDRVRHTWWLLGGPACVDVADRANADAFFDHLIQHEQQHRGLFDATAFEVSLSRLYAKPSANAAGGLQVMTIHKAKGLEFDHVIVPALDRSGMRDEVQLMQWLERPYDGASELLMSPIYPPEAPKKGDSIYCWLERLQRERQAHEDARLLYVAATRARVGLHLVACVDAVDAELGTPREHSLLQRLWPAVHEECRLAAEHSLRADAAPPPPAKISYDQALRRLPRDWTFPTMPPPLQWRRPVGVAVEPVVEFSWAGETARRVGIVVHRWLQQMADEQLQGWNTERLQTIGPHIERELAAYGVAGEALTAARDRVERSLANALADQRARWLLGPQHQARTELRLTLRDGDTIRRIVIDRTFVDQDKQRWIIDYKTGIHEGGNADVFLDREQQRYRQQLEGYAAVFDEPSQLGLYFPLVPGWRQWTSGDGDGE